MAQYFGHAVTVENVMSPPIVKQVVLNPSVRFRTYGSTMIPG